MVILICGHQRSGTTMVMQVLNTHPDLMITHELGNFFHLDQSYRSHVLWVLKQWWNQKDNTIFSKSFFRRRMFRGINMLNNFRFVLRYLFALRDSPVNRVSARKIEATLKRMFPSALTVGDKYPDYGFNLDKLAIADSVMCLFVYRDPRDVVSSTLRKARGDWRNWAPQELYDPSKIAARWNKMIDLWKENTERVVGIRYEDFVTEPRIETARLAKLLNVAPELFDCSSVHSKSIGNHKQYLTKQEIDSVTETTRIRAEKLGYTDQ